MSSKRKKSAIRQHKSNRKVIGYGGPIAGAIDNVMDFAHLYNPYNVAMGAVAGGMLHAGASMLGHTLQDWWNLFRSTKKVQAKTAIKEFFKIPVRNAGTALKHGARTVRHINPKAANVLGIVDVLADLFVSSDLDQSWLSLIPGTGIVEGGAALINAFTGGNILHARPSLQGFVDLITVGQGPALGMNSVMNPLQDVAHMIDRKIQDWWDYDVRHKPDFRFLKQGAFVRQSTAASSYFMGNVINYQYPIEPTADKPQGAIVDYPDAVQVMYLDSFQI
jgi:hypothetical protein